MFIKSLYLRHFRNYSETEVHFSPRLNLFYGENAQGKTNLLEAISLIATGRSFRTTRLQELIQDGAPFFFLEAKVIKNAFEHTVAITFDGQTKKLTLDGNSYSTLQHLLGLLPSVFFTPSDAELADGSPAVRRRFLNVHLAQRDPLYIHHLSRYWRAMKQRNALLRSVDLSAIACWEQEMAESASYLWKMRAHLLSEIQQPLQENALFLSGGRESYEIR
ncbi:MAG TPA: DNA replication and repair protein RecF, partial [Chlamydiales bacterium]|nr:DNA replication and repair protein RecF [Chlamydiales bacterium]